MRASQRRDRAPRRNPWKEEDLSTHAPCRRCGGDGKMVVFNHVHQGVCFGCSGSGKIDKDWRCTEPERFLLLGQPVRVYTVKEDPKRGSLRVLMKESDFQAHGTPGVLLESPFTATFFVVKGGRVKGATQRSFEKFKPGKTKPDLVTFWDTIDTVSVPVSSMLSAFPDYFDVMWPPEDAPGNPVRRAKMQRAHLALSEKLTHALDVYYWNRAHPDDAVRDNPRPPPVRRNSFRSAAWIDPGGVTHRLPQSQTHRNWAHQHLEYAPGVGDTADSRAAFQLLERGWIWFVSPTELNVWTEDAPPPAAWRAATDWSIQHASARVDDSTPVYVQAVHERKLHAHPYKQFLRRYSR